MLLIDGGYLALKAGNYFPGMQLGQGDANFDALRSHHARPCQSSIRHAGDGRKLSKTFDAEAADQMRADSQSTARASEAMEGYLARHVTTPAPFDRPQQYDANQRRGSGNCRPEGKDERAQGSGPIGVRYQLPARGEDQPTPVCAKQRAHYGVGISERTRRGGFPINGMNRFELRIRERRHANAAC